MSGEDTRERILQTAFKLFHEQGYHATGVAAIVREAGVNPGSMYHAFASKELLLENVLEYALTAQGPAVAEPIEAATADPIERVFALLDRHRESMAGTGCRLGCPMGKLALEVSDTHSEARELIHRHFENWVARVGSWLDAAGVRLPGTTDRRRLARLVITVMEGGLMQARAAGRLAPFDEAVAQLRDYFGYLEEPAAGAGGPAPEPLPPAPTPEPAAARKPRDGAFVWDDR
jgi:AcrR family transcriptional regulator